MPTCSIRRHPPNWGSAPAREGHAPGACGLCQGNPCWCTVRAGCWGRRRGDDGTGGGKRGPRGQGQPRDRQRGGRRWLCRSRAGLNPYRTKHHRPGSGAVCRWMWRDRRAAPRWWPRRGHRRAGLRDPGRSAPADQGRTARWQCPAPSGPRWSMAAAKPAGRPARAYLRAWRAGPPRSMG